MVNFFVLFKSLISFSKKDIDVGKTPSEIYKICSCVRETFCLSYAIRKNNNLYLYFFNERILIELKGTKLKFLGPDERSQALLLRKSLEKLQNLPNFENLGWIKSTPGFKIRRFPNEISFNNYLISNKYFKNFILIDPTAFTEELCYIETKDLKRIENLSGSTIVFLGYDNVKEEINLIKTIKERKGIIYVSTSRYKAIDDKILYFNYLIDKKENKVMP